MYTYAFIQLLNVWSRWNLEYTTEADESMIEVQEQDCVYTPILISNKVL